MPEEVLIGNESKTEPNSITIKKLNNITDIRDYEKNDRININFNYILKNIEDIIDLQYNFYKKMIINDGIIVKNRIKNTKFSYAIKIDNNLNVELISDYCL